MGHGLDENSVGLRAGRSCFSTITSFDVSRQRVQTAGQVEIPVSEVRAKIWNRMDRGTQLAYHAAREALEQAGLLTGTIQNLPQIIGTSAAAMPIGEAYYRQSLSTTARRSEQLRRVETYQSQQQLTTMARELKVSGPLRIVSNACASGANAIGQAFHLVRSGKAERVLAGGYDALSQLVFAGFDALQALSPSGIPRPFDAARDGLALGEGAAFVVVESQAAARARSVPILAEILGYGAATDIHHLTQPNPQGDAALLTMRAACEMAGVMPEQIDYLNSHGTGTPLNDIAEGNAIQRWAGNQVSKIKVSSTKSAIGHLLGGAGSVEAVITLLALRDQFLPASLHVREADPVCSFDLIREPRTTSVQRVLTNSFGFGGANATLIFAKEGAA
ncbi:beta-ketoacyl-[acyl-carrier-protein] synthase family protein [Luteolibacter pohnpeiensis]|uniref:Beta-ketoacyl-[acyl-carrier-protein] synthase family protein n=2 Tax=Luteolibacter pohnpeiensis TaxID=454153 RepID=A0A934S750_9BACT|nr:beta-ketoacyl-[acyl-carrier-protein] synthase family protein [Luteolibacter pohnpeiensis]